jgi:hypothetical protein
MIYLSRDQHEHLPNGLIFFVLLLGVGRVWSPALSTWRLECVFTLYLCLCVFFRLRKRRVEVVYNMYLLGVLLALLPLLGSCDGYDLHDGRSDITWVMLVVVMRIVAVSVLI